MLNSNLNQYSEVSVLLMQMFLQQLMALFLPTKDKVGLFAATLWKVLSEAL